MNVHAFSVAIAAKIGLNEAIILQHLNYWRLGNIDNLNMHRDGLVWSYHTIGSMRNVFPYLGTKAIRGALGRLVDKGYIISGNYNKVGFDQTKWYALTPSSIGLFDGGNGHPDGQMHLPKGQMELAKGQTYTINKTNNILLSNDNNNSDANASPVRGGFSDFEISSKKEEKEKRKKVAAKKESKAAAFARKLVELGCDAQVAEDYCEVRRAKRGAFTDTAIAGLVCEADKAGVSLQDAIFTCVMRGWVGFRADWMRGAKQQQGAPRRKTDDIVRGSDGRPLRIEEIGGTLTPGQVIRQERACSEWASAAENLRKNDAFASVIEI